MTPQRRCGSDVIEEIRVEVRKRVSDKGNESCGKVCEGKFQVTFTVQSPILTSEKVAGIVFLSEGGKLGCVVKQTSRD